MHTVQVFTPIREFTQEKNLINAKCEVRASATAPIFTYVKEIIPERSHVSVTSVVRASVGIQIFIFLRKQHYNPEFET